MSFDPGKPQPLLVEHNSGVVANHIDELHVHQPHSQSYERQLADYYRKVAKSCRITTMDDHHPAGRGSQPTESDVAQVYVDPDVWKVTIQQHEDEESQPSNVQKEQLEHRERVTWQSCFDSQEEGLRQLLLVADGGMGKTTAVDVQIQRLVEKGDTVWMALRLPRLLEVRSRVGGEDVVEVALSSDIATKLSLAVSQAEAVAHEVLNRLDKQPGVILLDALDEVPQSERKWVVSGVLRFLNRMLDRQPNHKVLITSRAYAVEDVAIGQRLAKSGFVRLELARLSEEQRAELVQKYFAVRGRNAEVGTALLRQLTASDVGGVATIGELMREPMLATYACMLAEGRASAADTAVFDAPLPASRHELLEGVVSLLLERWDVQRRDSEQTRGFKDMFLVNGIHGRSPLRHVLEQAALMEHLHAAQIDAAKRSDAARPREHGVHLPDDMELESLYEAIYHGDAHDALGADWLLARIDEQMRADLPLRAHHIFEWVTRRSGLVSLDLDARGRARPKIHRQLGDFLAAAAMWLPKIDTYEYAAELVQLLQISPDWSRDLVSLGWERLVASAEGDPKKLVPALSASLMAWESWCESVNQFDSDTGTATLSFALAQALPWEWLKNNQPLNAALQAFRVRLAAIVEQQRLSPPERANVADALGRLGDPRFAPGLWLPSERFVRNSAAEEPLPGFVRVPAGVFWMGAEGEVDNPPYEAEIDSDFYISRCLTTVAQYQRFVDAGGYGGWIAEKDAAVWGAGGLAFRDVYGLGNKKQLRRSPGWTEQLVYPHRPVVNISWWEARAYARWLNTDPAWQRAQSQVSSWAGYRVCLPTELQWERAARLNEKGGAHRQLWPWSDEAEDFDQRANVAECRVGRVSVVGCFAPNPLGIWDLSGNAREWMDNAIDEPAHAPQRMTAVDEPSLDNKRLPALRGGAWLDNGDDVRVSIRDRIQPGGADLIIGFRVVLSLAP